MTTLDWTLLGLLLAWNLAVFILYAIDKSRARRKARRIPEKTLLACAFFLGGAGGMAGMLVFRHKTRHLKFRLLLPLALLVTLAAAVAYAALL